MPEAAASPEGVASRASGLCVGATRSCTSRSSGSASFHLPERVGEKGDLIKGVAQALKLAIDDPFALQKYARKNAGQRSSGDSSADTSRSTQGVTQRHHNKTPHSQQFFAIFDSSVIPPIAVEKYLVRLATTFKCSEAVFVCALILVDRLLSCQSGQLSLTKKNVHRLFLASLVVSVKYHEDLVYCNKHYGKAGGVHVREVNRLEHILLIALDFDLRIHMEQYKLYEEMLLDLSVIQAKSSPPPEK